MALTPLHEVQAVIRGYQGYVARYQGYTQGAAESHGSWSWSVVLIIPKGPFKP